MPRAASQAIRPTPEVDGQPQNDTPKADSAAKGEQPDTQEQVDPTAEVDETVKKVGRYTVKHHAVTYYTKDGTPALARRGAEITDISDSSAAHLIQHKAID